MAKDYIKVPAICLESIRMLSDAERGRLYLAVLEYGQSGRERILDGAERLVFATLKARMDRDQATGAKRAESGRMGGAAKAGKRKQTVANCGTPPSPLSPPSPPTPPVTPVTPTPTPKEKPPKGGKKKAPFVPPTAEEVEDYCRERGSGIDPEAFWAYYEANGWTQGKSRKPIVNWRACLLTWERQRKAEEPPEPPPRRRYKTVERDGKLVDVEVEA